jgi:hypothetical protein
LYRIGLVGYYGVHHFLGACSFDVSFFKAGQCLNFDGRWICPIKIHDIC